MSKAASKNSLPWARPDTLALILVTAFGALIRFIRLTIPAGFVFDETYYAKDACLYLRLGQFVCHTEQATEQSYVHPPLGKWLIAIGIKIFGYNEFGWRVAAAVFGTATIALVYLLARKLFRDRWIATVAGLLVASDFLLIVQSRISMLDIFQTFF
ncbi:MAG: phospholipid carrier-dependent glycosyltransferase, partial [Actinomycetota bacterium]